MIRLPGVVAFFAAIVGPHGAAAQIFTQAPASHAPDNAWIFDVGGQMAAPVGAFRTQVNRAWGFGGSVRYHFLRFKPLGLRGDVSWLNYGNETKNVPLSPTVNRVFVDMHTMNNIAVVSAGPELMVPRGPIRPYAFAFAGYSYFYTESSASDDAGGGTFASSTNFGDGGWATGWGGGLRVPVAMRSVEVAFDAGARLTRNGTRTYLRSGDVVDLPDRSLAFNTRTTSADFWQYHLGASFSPRRRER